MPYCPECEYKYPRHVDQCPVCASSLVDTLDEDASFLCDECKEPVPEDARSCSNCGTVFVKDLGCFQHPDIPPHGICVVCGQHLCSQCSDRQLGRYFCERHGGEEVQPELGAEEAQKPLPDWEAVLFQRHLKQDGVESRLFDADHDRHLICSVDNDLDIKLIAPFGTRKQVARILIDREIEDEVVLFQCSRCSAISRMKDTMCPNCGR